MDRIAVTSSNLASVGYDEPTETLEIQFNDGSVYEYSAVPLDVYRGLMAAGSKGQYHHQFIRTTYQYARVSG